MAEDATREDLMAYHRLLREQQTLLLSARDELDERRRLADALSDRRQQLSSRHSSSSGCTPATRAPKRRSRLERIPEGARHEITRSLGSSFMTVDEDGNMVPKTPEAAVLATTTYLLSTQPPADDPRAALHRQTIRGLGMIGVALTPVDKQGTEAAIVLRQSDMSPPPRDHSP